MVPPFGILVVVKKQQSELTARPEASNEVYDFFYTMCQADSKYKGYLFTQTYYGLLR